MKTFNVTIPIAGHVSFEIEAETKEAAIKAACDADPIEGEVTWEMLESFNQGNVCFCPSPWEVTAKEVSE
jgi:hypothetical protein